MSLIDPFSQNVVATTVTDASGIAFFDDIQEGVYNIRVGADQHRTYVAPYTITPGSFGEQEVFLPRQTVNYQWNVVPTEIRDEYKITLDTIFETDVPIPVVTMTPGNIDLSKLSQLPGEVNQIDFTITNHGLIAAENVELFFPNHLLWDFKPLVAEIEVLPAKSSLTVPVIIKNRGFQISDVSLSNLESPVIDAGFTKTEAAISSLKQGNTLIHVDSISSNTESKFSENTEFSVLAASKQENISTPDAGYYYDPSNQLPFCPLDPKDPTKKSPVAPDLTPLEVYDLEFGTDLTGGNFYTGFLSDVGLVFGSQTRELYKLFLDSSPSNPAPRQFYTDGDEIVEGGGFVGVGFKNSSVTKSYVEGIFDIMLEEILDELSRDLKDDCQITEKSWDVANLLPSYYLEPNHNKNGRDRDCNPVTGLPSNPLHLDYTPGLNSISTPALIAGGVGYGGTAELPDVKDIHDVDKDGDKTEILREAQPTRRLIPDSRKIKGHIKLVKTGANSYVLKPAEDFKIVINDTVDYSPGNLLEGFGFEDILKFGSYFNIDTLWKLETNGGAFDVPFTVEFTPEFEKEFSTGCNLQAWVLYSWLCGPYDNFQTSITNFLNASDCCPPGISGTASGGSNGGGGSDGGGGGGGFLSIPVFFDPCALINITTATDSSAPLQTNAEDSVCARVKLQIDQEAVMTRSAFLGELEIENGNSTSLQNITVNLQVKDAQGNVVNNLFGITNPLLNNITAVDGTGILSGDDPNTPQDEGIGSAQWTFIPTNLAAPDVPTQYSIGGSLSYVENGQTITVPLLSTPVTVYPQAELYLDYFQERNVYADDPFTDSIETSVPFSLGVLVRNEGKGTAKDLSITSAQPKIIENEKGLLIDFQIIGSQVNGNDVSPSLTANFGDIQAGETAVAEWLLKSSLQGKFIDYSATFKHVNDLGNPELSLIKQVNIHELIRKVQVNHPTDDGLSDFLVNDIFDANFYPDTLYFSNGGTAPVNTVTNTTTDGTATIADLQVQVTATTEAGWSYVRLVDPANGQLLIKSILQADGTEIPIDNLWRTDRTFPATGRPIYENILHFLDHNTTAGEQTYTIVYTTGDRTVPKVREIIDVDPNPRNTPITTIDVVFSEAIRPETFDYTDLALTLDGNANLITDAVTLTQIDPLTYRIGNLAALTGNVGQYQLSVNASGIQDLEGLSGIGTVNENWIFTGDRPAVASITGIPGNQLNAPFDAIEVTFTKAINPTSFDFSDLFLNRDQGGNLTNNSLNITSISSTTYRISNLSGLTSIDGNYLLLVDASSVTDTTGNTGIGSKGFNWTLDTNAPQIMAITDVASPRNTKVSTLDISFSTPIDPTTFDLSDLLLTQDGSTNLITSNANLIKLTDANYRLTGLNSLQASDGTYTLAIVGNGIQDTAGNAVTNNRSESWTLDTLAPTAAINLQANGNSVNSTNQIRVNSTTVELTGSVNEIGLSVYFRDKLLNQTIGQATLNGTTFNGTVQLTSPGARALEVQVIDAAGNITTTPLNLFVDTLAPATPGVTIATTNGNTTVTEDGITDTYTIALKTQPTANVILTIATSNQLALDQKTLTFTSENWNTPQTVTIAAVNDTLPEGTQTATIVHAATSTDPNYQNVTIPPLSVAIADNDAEIRGIKWLDSNGDGVQDATELGLANWKIYLDTNRNSQHDAGEQFTLTDTNGNYSFTDLRPGTYTVAEEMQDGWRQTFPRINVTTTAANTQFFTPSAPITLLNDPSATTVNQRINLNAFRADPRFTPIDGRGFTAVVIDTGIDLNHTFFGADSDGNGISDRIIYQYDFADNDSDASDRNGHGSHVASIIASSDSTNSGIAPQANLIALKVFKDNGSGYFSDLEKSLQWVINHAATYNIASVNLSLGDERNWNTDAARYGIGDELAALAAQGIIVTTAAGNNFAQFGSTQGLAYPAADPNTIAVGAIWGTNDQIADFSQRHKDLLEIFAPGIPIVGADANGGIQTLGGTSQAAPFIAGIAVLAQQIATEKLGRKLTVNEFKHLLATTSDIIRDGDDEIDRVTNTGLNFPRINLFSLAEGILRLGNTTSVPTTGTANINSSNDPLYLPNQASILPHTVTLSAGQVATDINFGNQQIPVPGTLAFTNTQYAVDEAGTAIASVIVDRTGGSDGAVSATITLTNGTAISPEDYSNTEILVSFADGEMSKTVAIPVVNDAIVEGSETLILTLTDPTGGATLGTQNTATLTIVDDDISLAFSSPQFSVNEDGTAIAAVTITRVGRSTGEVGAKLTLRNGTASAPSDYRNLPIEVRFADGEMSKTITVPIIDDTLAEANETIRLALTEPTGGATLGTQNTATLTIVENDVQLVFGSTPFGIREDGTPISAVTIRRLGSATKEVSVTLVASDGTAKASEDYNNTPIEIRFLAGETTKTVLVPVVNDTLPEGNETILLELQNPTGSATLGANPTATLLVLDNDAPPLGQTLIGNDRNNKLTGLAKNDSLYGGSGNDTLLGGAGNDLLDGGTGNDTLDGGIGDDVFIGGTGNDTYSVDSNNDQITEDIGAGTDTVRSSLNWTLGENFENLVLVGSSAIEGKGNTLNNTITGNDSNNLLSGEAGNDTLRAEAGDDRLEGGSGNDILDGGIGEDTFVGGAGNDTYRIDNLNDQIIEDSNAGTDTVQATLNWTLGEHLENLTLVGSGAIEGQGNGLNNSMTGNAANNVLIGAAGNDTLKGNAGDDSLDGGTGNDTLDGGIGQDEMTGGTGNDTYTVDQTSDRVIETANAGTDTIRSSLSWSLGDHLENLALSGTQAINGTGNGLNNVITGNSASNTLRGAEGNDTLRGAAGEDVLIGGFGTDTLTGGADRDQFVYNNFGEAGDTITDFNIGQDQLVLRSLFQSIGSVGSDPIADGYLRFVQIRTATQVQIDLDGAGTSSTFRTLVTLNNISSATLTSDNLVV